MSEVVLKTPEGDKPGNSAGVETVRVENNLQPRRVSLVDLDGPLGQFLAEALCFIAPNAFNPNNWKGKLSNFITSKTSSFLCCGRAVGLSYLEQDPMTGENEAKGLFILAAEGGTEEDTIAVLRAQKQWARDLGIGFRLPHKEYSSLSPSKLQTGLKAEKREELIVLPLAKK